MPGRPRRARNAAGVQFLRGVGGEGANSDIQGVTGFGNNKEFRGNTRDLPTKVVGYNKSVAKARATARERCRALKKRKTYPASWVCRPL